MTEKISKALYRGELPIGGIKLDCFVLDNNESNPMRILSQGAVFKAFDRPRKGMNDRLEIDGTKIPPFIAAGNLKPLINSEIIEWTKPVYFSDNGDLRYGYRAELLPLLCDLYLEAQRRGILLASQQKIADQAGRLLSAFAKVGFIALIDEVTGYQVNRKYDALRLLLESYLTEKPTGWAKQFPDDFFYEMDRLYGNEKMKSNQRPAYYGNFINKYVYEPIEKGKINPELQQMYKEHNKNQRKHQFLTEQIGKPQLQIQIGKIMGLMQVAPNLGWFKQKQSRQGQLSLFPNMD